MLSVYLFALLIRNLSTPGRQHGGRRQAIHRPPRSNCGHGHDRRRRSPSPLVLSSCTPSLTPSNPQPNPTPPPNPQAPQFQPSPSVSLVPKAPPQSNIGPPPSFKVPKQATAAPIPSGPPRGGAGQEFALGVKPTVGHLSQAPTSGPRPGGGAGGQVRSGVSGQSVGFGPAVGPMTGELPRGPGAGTTGQGMRPTGPVQPPGPSSGQQSREGSGQQK